ncbi:MAG TPA: IS5 family transposase [Caulobacteraceae bacterium]
MAGSKGFADAFADPRLGSNETLERIDGLVAWAELEGLALEVRPGVSGRPPYAALSMLKALYLQAMYDLSDPGLEAALLDRVSFRRFCGWDLSDRTPDETTLCRFRQEAARAGVLERAFAVVNGQLEAKRLILKRGTLMDATLVAARHNPPKMKAGPGAGVAGEPDANWTKKNGKSHFGYKLHVGMDQGSGLVRSAVMTPAKTADIAMAPQLIIGDEAAVYGDKAYSKKALNAALKARGAKPRIAYRRHKTEPVLTRWKKRRNDLIARIRAPVEGVFSQAKRFYGLARARCHTLQRNQSRAFAILTIFNLKRAVRLTAA